jgi:hypothetical protein
MPECRLLRGFGGREGARTPDLLVANEKLAVQDVRNVQLVQQIAFSGRKLLRAFSLADWTLKRTPNLLCESQNSAARYRIFRIVSPAFPIDSLNQWAFGFAPWIRMVIGERLVVESALFSGTPFLEVQLGRTPQGSIVIRRGGRTLVGRGGATRGRTCEWSTRSGAD